MKTMSKFFAVAIVAAMVLPVSAASIILPGDPVIGGQLDGAGGFAEGTEGFTIPGNNWPGGENPSFAIDGSVQKYLNFGQQDTGIIVSPSGGESIVNKIKVWTANDAIERDPASYQIWGSSDPSVHASVAGGVVSLASFTLVNGGPLNLPDTGASMSRNMGDTSTPIDDALYYTATTFENTDAYCTYAIVFPQIKDPATANSMQMAEVQLHGDFTGNACPVPEPSAAVLLGLSLLLVPALRRKK